MSQTLPDGRLMHGIYAHALLYDRDLNARSQWLSTGNTSARKQAVSIKSVTTVGDNNDTSI